MFRSSVLAIALSMLLTGVSFASDLGSLDTCFPVDARIPLSGKVIIDSTTDELATGIYPESLNGFVTLNEYIAVIPVGSKNRKTKKKSQTIVYEGVGTTTGIGLHLEVTPTCKSNDKDCAVNIEGYAVLDQSAQAQLRSLPQANPCIRAVDIRSWSQGSRDPSLLEDVYVYVDVAGKNLRR